MTENTMQFLTILGAVLGAFVFLWREINSRFDKVDARFDKVDARFDKVDARLDKVEGIVTGLNTRLALVESKMADLNTNVSYLMWHTQAIPPPKMIGEEK